MSKNFVSHTLIFVLIVICVSCQFDTTRFRIIDRDEDHVLVRGNLPIHNNTFQFEELYKALSVFTGTSGYRLVIYSLLNLLTAKQTKNRYIQENYFNSQGEKRYNNQLNLYYNHDIVGSFFSPAQYPAILKKYALKYYNFTSYDKIPTLLERIERNMRSPIKTIVYVHCSQGIDRAGYVAGAYKMKNLGASFKQVIKENLQIMSKFRSYIHFNSFNGLQWYCLYLKKNEEQCLVGVQGASRGDFEIKSKQNGSNSKSQSENKEKAKK